MFALPFAYICIILLRNYKSLPPLFTLEHYQFFKYKQTHLVILKVYYIRVLTSQYETWYSGI